MSKIPGLRIFMSLRPFLGGLDHSEGSAGSGETDFAKKPCEAFKERSDGALRQKNCLGMQVLKQFSLCSVYEYLLIFWASAMQCIFNGKFQIRLIFCNGWQHLDAMPRGIGLPSII